MFCRYTEILFIYFLKTESGFYILFALRETVTKYFNIKKPLLQRREERRRHPKTTIYVILKDVIVFVGAIPKQQFDTLSTISISK